MIIECEINNENNETSRQYRIKEKNISMFVLYRNDINEYRETLNGRYSLYFLFGNEHVNRIRSTYIGQTQDIVSRLSKHIKEKDFWECAVIFSGIEEKYNKSQIQYLEYISIKKVIECGNASILENCQIPKEPYLNGNDINKTNEIFKDVMFLIEFAGFFPFRKTNLFDMSEIKNENSHNVIKRITNEYYRIPHEEYDEGIVSDRMISYEAKGKDYNASAIEKGDEVMIMPFGYISESSDIDKISEIVPDLENKIGLSSRHIKTDIICKDFETAAYIITGKYDSGLWKKNINII